MTQSLSEKTKELIVDPKLRIKLHDLVAKKIRELQSSTNEEKFPVQGTCDIEEFSNRLKEYERAVNDLIEIYTLLGYWATDDQVEIFPLQLRKLSDRIKPISGNATWLALRWYPILLLTYSSGIASVAASNYGYLSNLLHIKTLYYRNEIELPLTLVLISDLGNSENDFKQLPGHEKLQVPRSEYLYEKVKPIMDELLFIDDEYDWLFDRFELLFALEHAHLKEKIGLSSWGPIGRFGWKHRGGESSPFLRLIKEAEQAGNDWEPLRQGFFDGTFERFVFVSSELSGRLIRY